MRTFRNVFRRKLRAFLTIFGITIGVLALIVMGAIAEKLNMLVDGGVRYYADKVIVTSGDEQMGISTVPLTMSKLREIRAVTGVAAVFPEVGLFLEEDIGAVNMGQPPSIQAQDLGARPYDTFKVGIREGRDLQPGDHKAVVVGSDLVRQLEAQLGGTIEIRGEDFRVVGIRSKTLTAPDNTVSIPLSEARRIYIDSLPASLQEGLDPNNVATSFLVFPTPGVRPDTLATVINNRIDGIKATGPSEFQRTIVDQLKIFTNIIFGIALVSLLVGGLSVINTMTISVSERTREIGVRKAIGATNGAIMRQFLAESALIGAVGGLVGLALGWLIVTGLNAAGEASGNAIFLVSPRLAIGSVAFALVLGTLSGLYPAYHAASLNPVQALRYE